MSADARPAGTQARAQRAQKSFDIGAGNNLHVFYRFERSLLGLIVAKELGLPWFLRSEGLQTRVDRRVEIVDEAFLAHVVDDLARGVVCAETFAPIFLDEILEDFAEHFGINGDFLFQRLGFIDGEVVAVEYVEQAASFDPLLNEIVIGKKAIGQDNIGFPPVVVTERFE